MTLDVSMITFDCTDPDVLAQWWAQAVGSTAETVAPGYFDMVRLPSGLRLGFQKVDDPTPGKNRVHLDLTGADREAEVSRLIELGASETARHNAGDFVWVVLADPAGNAFCVAAG
jgi:hypothetical protein